ncbi:hypothetical protein BOTBODRAFT_190793 [Botryobasidium botryosum FD-172 SS1]|uniref:F-box domain-containing protein n=1 Tax=Botryobasidium botryosum (strain FD-172 SS1) TaxID=930990 RepID=A0A067M5N6_BOTB1|nr:hypothetical protein BOTBODRAFT_190793 [Botryobasidium botryosum FD-172 SS1]
MSQSGLNCTSRADPPSFAFVDYHQAKMKLIVAEELPELFQLLYDIGRPSSAEERGLRAQRLESKDRTKATAKGLSTILDEESEMLALIRNVIVDSSKSYMAEKISTIRAQRNRLSPIYRLPNETLSAVFEFANCHEPSSGSTRSLRTPAILARVSKRWREIALTTSSLWTTINVVNQCAAEIFATRSNNALLDIELLHNHAHLCCFPRKIFISLGPACPSLAFFEDALAALRWASLYLPYTARQLHQPCFTQLICEPYPKPSHFEFGWDLPAPAMLHLLWLTMLCLINISFSTEFTANQFICAVAAASPRPQRFALDALRFSDSDAHGWTSPPDGPWETATFPDLKHITICFFASGPTHRIFRSMRLPPDAVLEMKGRWDNLSDIFYPGLDFSSHLPSILSVRELDINFNVADGCCRIDGTVGGTMSAIIIGFCGVESVGRAHRLGQIYRQLARVLPTASVEELIIEIAPRTAISDIVALLADFPSITSLLLSRPSIDVVKLLLITPTMHLCPGLEKLILMSSPISEAGLIELALSRTKSEGPEAIQLDAQMFSEPKDHLRSIEIVDCHQVHDEVALGQILAGLDLTENLMLFSVVFCKAKTELIDAELVMTLGGQAFAEGVDARECT